MIPCPRSSAWNEGPGATGNRVAPKPAWAGVRPHAQRPVAAEPGHEVVVGGSDIDVAGRHVQPRHVVHAPAGTRAADQRQGVGVQPVVRRVGGGGRAVAVADHREVRARALVGRAQAVDEVGQVVAPGLGESLAADAAHVDEVAGDVEQLLGVPAGCVVAHPGDHRGAPAVRGGLLEQPERVLALAGDRGEVVGQAGHDHGGVVRGVGVAVADRARAVAAEGAGQVEHEVGVQGPPGARVGHGQAQVEGGPGGLGAHQHPALGVGERHAAVLQRVQVVEVVLEGGAVGLVPVAAGDAVGVADQLGAVQLQCLLLGGGEVRPPAVHGPGVAAQRLQPAHQRRGVRDRRVVGAPLGLPLGVHRGERRDQAVLRRGHPALPGLDPAQRGPGRRRRAGRHRPAGRGRPPRGRCRSSGPGRRWTG